MVDEIFQLVVDASKLDISSISITECEEGFYSLSMTARVYNTGPIPAVIDSFTVALCSDMGDGDNNSSQKTAGGGTGYGTPFSFVTMPKMRVEPGGVTMSIKNQRVKISNMTSYDTFNRRLINSAEFPLYIVGKARVSALTGLMGAETRYDKVVVLRGMNGLKIDLLATRAAISNGSAVQQLLRGLKKAKIETDVVVHNSSKVAVEMGEVAIGVVYRDATIARLSAHMHLRPGPNNITLHGELVLGSLLKPSIGISFLKNDLSKDADVQATVVGLRGGQCGWLHRVVRQLYTPIRMDGTLKDLVQSISQGRPSLSGGSESSVSSNSLNRSNTTSRGSANSSDLNSPDTAAVEWQYNGNGRL